MIEAEMAFTETLEDLTKFIEKFIKTVLQRLLDTLEEEISYYRDIYSLGKFDSGSVLSKPYTIMTYEEAWRLLEQDENNF